MTLKTFRVATTGPYDICGGLNYNQNNGFNDEYDIAISENDSIKFYCCEVGTTQTIILRVYQLDINGNWAYYTDEFGEPLRDAETNCIQYIYNECMIDVEVQDKIKPVCLPPAHVTVACENFEPSLWAYGYPSGYDNCCLDETPPTSANPQGVTNIPAGTTAVPGVCGLTQKTYYSGFLDATSIPLATAAGSSVASLHGIATASAAAAPSVSP
ncbi:MAG: hypothetical protein IPL27_06545 [Lewinellaceae bacterium]|nr:hypothetical protein [Lewinellaceae bacterium]